MQHTNASKTPRPASLIETISQGFAAVNRRLWIVAIPVLIDVFFWLGPRISLHPLADRLRMLDPKTWDALRQQMVEQFGPQVGSLDVRAVGLLNIVRFVYTLVPTINTPPPPIAPSTWHIGSFATLVGVFALINILGLIVTTLYLVPLADVVRGTDDPQPRLLRMAKVIGSFASIVLIVAAIGLLVGIPLILLATFMSLLSEALGQLVALFWATLLIWLLFTASFSFDAVVVSGVGPLRALLTSLFIVQRSFWSAVGLFLLGWFILAGMSIVWQAVSTTDIGLVLAILGSAYLTSGLAAAHLIFYRERLSRVGRRA